MTNDVLKNVVNLNLIERLRVRANVRRNINQRKSAQGAAPDSIANLLEEAANEIERLQNRRWWQFWR